MGIVVAVDHAVKKMIAYMQLMISVAIQCPMMASSLQLLVLFYIIKQLLHTPSLNSMFITTLGVDIPLGLRPRGILSTPWVVIIHAIQ